MCRFRAAGRRVIGTSRRRPIDDCETIYLDLNNPPRVWERKSPATAYICAAVARLDACRRDPTGSTRVNVDGAIRLARLLAEQGTFVVYLSTNHVFDGSLPYRRPDEVPCPVTEYGREKVAAEQHILALNESACVLRLTKVLSERVSLFDGWIDNLRKRERIYPFSDMSMAPVPLDLAVEILSALGARWWSGMHHLSGNRDVTYAKIAHSVAERMDVDVGLVEPVPALWADPTAEQPPRYTTLDLVGLPARLGITMPDVETTIGEAIKFGEIRSTNAA